jgi:TonB family protein
MTTVSARVLVTFFFLLFPVIGSRVVASGTETLPATRPALVSTNTDSVAAKLVYPPQAIKANLSGAFFFACDVDRSGRASKFRLYRAPQKHQILIRAIESALREGRFEPARQDGQPVGVTINACVMFLLTEQGPLIAFYPHWDEESMRTRENLISPQQIIDGPGSASTPSAAASDVKEGQVAVKFLVNTLGTVTDVQVVNGADSEAVATAATDFVKATRLIPMFRNGKPEPCWVTQDFYFLAGR